jgi:hypothetical protein
MRPSRHLIARAALRLATAVRMSGLLWNVVGAFVVADLVRGALRLGPGKDRLREEVAHFIEEYDGLDDEALDDLLTAFIVRPYPTRAGQDS